MMMMMMMMMMICAYVFLINTCYISSCILFKYISMYILTVSFFIIFFLFNQGGIKS
jgi:hypothetical protein